MDDQSTQTPASAENDSHCRRTRDSPTLEAAVTAPRPMSGLGKGVSSEPKPVRLYRARPLLGVPVANRRPLARRQHHHFGMAFGTFAQGVYPSSTQTVLPSTRWWPHSVASDRSILRTDARAATKAKAVPTLANADEVPRELPNGEMAIVRVAAKNTGSAKQDGVRTDRKNTRQPVCGTPRQRRCDPT